MNENNVNFDQPPRDRRDNEPNTDYHRYDYGQWCPWSYHDHHGPDRHPRGFHNHHRHYEPFSSYGPVRHQGPFGRHWHFGQHLRFGPQMYFPHFGPLSHLGFCGFHDFHGPFGFNGPFGPFGFHVPEETCDRRHGNCRRRHEHCRSERNRDQLNDLLSNLNMDTEREGTPPTVEEVRSASAPIRLSAH